MDKNLRCDIALVRDAGVGGRILSVVFDKEVPNGHICQVGGLIEGESEIRQGLDRSKASEDMYIVMKPEINPNESSKENAKLGKHRNPAGKAVPVIRLQARDRIALSEDHIENIDSAEELEVGDILHADANNGLHLIKEVVKDGFYLKVIRVEKDSFDGMIYTEEGYERQGYNMVLLEVVLLTAQAPS